MISFVTASHKEDVLVKNLLQSHGIINQVLHVMRDYNNIAKAYNNAKPLVYKDHIVVYVHHDVFMPSTFLQNLNASLKKMQRIYPNWGVLGVAGVKMVSRQKKFLGYVKDRGKIIGSREDLPAEVDTLDELLLITRGDFVFDENIPGTHFYGADICMQAKLQGRKNYVINAYLEHNSSLAFGTRPADFEPCKEYFRNKYIDHLPIATTCTIVT